MNGKQHDTLTVFAAICSAALCWQPDNLSVTTSISVGCLIGGFILSPDLDTKSSPLRRWSILGFIWIIYHKVIPHSGGTHRSWVSHTPIISSQMRLIYLSIISFGLLPTLVNQVFDGNLVRFAIGVEIAAAMHLIADGLHHKFYALIGFAGAVLWFMAKQN